jgi:hypothetical protein
MLYFRQRQGRKGLILLMLISIVGHFLKFDNRNCMCKFLGCYTRHKTIIQIAEYMFDKCIKDLIGSNPQLMMPGNF